MSDKIFLTDSTHKDGYVDIQFKFSWKAVNMCKGLSSRRFDGDRKIWMIPKHVLTELRTRAKLEGFRVVDETTSETIRIRITPEGFTLNCDDIFVNSKTGRMLSLKRPRDGYEYAKELEKAGYKVRIIDRYPLIDIPQNTPKVQLYDYQEEAMKFLRAQDYRGLLALDVGLGKTVIAGNAINELGKGPVLVVVPASLIYQWKHQLKKHFDIEAEELLSNRIKKEDRIERLRDADIAITNYEFLRSIDIEELNKKYALVVLDEVHRIKNWKTGVSQTISKIISPRMLGLTATPIENNIIEIYNICDQLIAGSLGSMKEFKRDHIIEDRWGAIEEQVNLPQLFKKLEKNVMFRRTWEEVENQLPEIIEKIIVVPPTKKEIIKYNTLFDKNINLESVTNTKVFCSLPSLKMENHISSKEKELFSLLENFNERVVIMTEYKKTALALHSGIENRNVYLINGDVKKEDKRKVIKEFQEDKTGVLISTIAEGIDGLQVSKILINFDIAWSSSKMEQRLGRLKRIGGQNKIIVFNVLLDVDFDWKVWELIQKKKELFDTTINGVQTEMLNYLRKDIKKMKI